MKRVIASAGAFAVGMAGLHGANVTGLTPQEQSKWWIVSGSLRTFYDDNSLNAPADSAVPSFGIEFKPGIAINLPYEQTLISASYDFTLNYYEARPDSKVDQDHFFDVRFNHKFTERYEADVQNSFIYSDAPQILDTGGAITTTQRRGDSSGLRNRATIDFNARLTPVAGLASGYKNNLRDYKQTGVGSYSALLDSIEQLFHIDAQLFPSEHTVLFVGYQFGFIDYTSSDPLGYTYVGGTLPGNGRPPGSGSSTNQVAVLPDTKNNTSHYLYVGGRREFSRQLSGAGKIGLQFTDYYNLSQTSWSPYLDLTSTYEYLPGSSGQLGLSVGRIPTDVVGVSATNGSVTLDGLAASAYATLTHRFTSRITGICYLNYQHTVYNGGDFDGQTADYVTIDTRLDYKLRENFFADLGYIWTHNLSSIPNSSFNRNRVYIGVRATY